jgi:hypothetical protein
MAATRTFLQGTVSTADQTTYTFSSQNLGSAAADRYIVVCIQSRRASGTPTVNSVSVGGVSATIVNQVGNTGSVAAIAIAAVPSGTSGDVVVTFDSGMLRCAVELYRVTGIGSAAAHDSGVSTAAPPSRNMAIPAGGLAVGCAAFSQASGSATWSGLTEDYDTSAESLLTCTSASGEFATEQSSLAVTCTPSAGASPVGVFASWAPAASSSFIDNTQTILSLLA